jgi:V8-like Glu-specific endopeptidase
VAVGASLLLFGSAATPASGQTKPPMPFPDTLSYELLSPAASNRTLAGSETILMTTGEVKRISEMDTSSAAPLVRYSNGAVGLAVPVSADLQKSAVLPPASPGSLKEDLVRLSEIERSGGRKFTQEIGRLPEAVIGADDRVRATPTNYYPRSAMVKITTGDFSNCSGTLYASNKVVTAAHCLYDFGKKQWRPYPWIVQPGRDGTTLNFGQCTSIVGAFVLGGYLTSDKEQNDLGGIKLGCSYPGSVGNGYYPLVALPNLAIQAGKDGLYIVGYPVFKQGVNVNGQQWEHNGRLIWDSTFLKTLNVDSSGGQSGGAWAIPCTEYGWYYCHVGPHTGSAAFLVGGMNTGHQTTAADITALNNL